ncbi:MAG: hypothetical protein ISN29_09520, partial [Gammaproteobacteria bacterium AqS3]|nr:hypothetical protein [Gammaproteobacteria bacterium AqS3]
LEDGRPLHSGAGATAAAASARGAALLDGFSYALSPEEAGGAGWSIWGRTGSSGFSRDGDADAASGAGGDIPFDGAQRSVWLGFDRRTDGGVLSGVAYASSSSDSDHELREFDAGMETDLSIVLPYMEISTDGGPSAHLMVGLVDGEATLNQTGGIEGSAALSMYLVVAGGSRPAAQLKNSTLSWSADLNFSRLSTSEAELAALRDISVSSMRFRGGVELAHSGLGRTWTAMPSLGVRLRHDTGDGVTGTGIELNADMQVLNSSKRFGFGFGVRMLTAHSDDEFSDWGAGLQLHLNPGSSGEGLEFALGPTWGAQDDALLDRDEAFRLGASDLRNRRMRQRGRGLAGSLGYGLRTLGGLLTPYSEYRLTSGEHGGGRQVAGVRFLDGNGVDLRLFSERRILARGKVRSRLAVELQRRF